jgi:hypothetical protein
MAIGTNGVMLGKDELSPADEALPDLPGGGLVTAPFAADETGYSLQYVRDRLRRLVGHAQVSVGLAGLGQRQPVQRRQSLLREPVEVLLDLRIECRRHRFGLRYLDTNV